MVGSAARDIAAVIRALDVIRDHTFEPPRAPLGIDFLKKIRAILRPMVWWNE
jgi:hypothetical protein